MDGGERFLSEDHETQDAALTILQVGGSNRMEKIQPLYEQYLNYIAISETGSPWVDQQPVIIQCGILTAYFFNEITFNNSRYLNVGSRSMDPLLTALMHSIPSYNAPP